MRQATPEGTRVPKILRPVDWGRVGGPQTFAEVAVTASTADRYLDAFIARNAARRAVAEKDSPEHRQWLDDCNARLDELFDTRADCE